MRGAETFGSTEVNNQLTTIKLPSTFPLSKKPKVKTAWLVYCKTYTSIAPNNYLVSYARKHSNIFAVTLIQFDKEFEVIHYFISSKCRLFENFPSVKVARYSFSGSIPPTFERKLRRHKQRFGKTDTTVVLDKDENLL